MVSRSPAGCDHPWMSMTVCCGCPSGLQVDDPRQDQPERCRSVGVDVLTGLDRDDIGADRLDTKCGGDPGDHILGQQMACSSSTWTNTWVPVESPSWRRAAAQNASCACVNAPLARELRRGQRPQQRRLDREVRPDRRRPVGDPAVVVLGVGGREQIVQGGDGVDLRHRDAVVAAEPAALTFDTPPFSWAPSNPGHIRVSGHAGAVQSWPRCLDTRPPLEVAWYDDPLPTRRRPCGRR